MSTPNVNSVGTTDFTPVPGNDGALQYGTKWGDAYGTGVTLTYSFPGGGYAWFIDGYQEFNAWYPLTSPEKRRFGQRSPNGRPWPTSRSSR